MQLPYLMYTSMPRMDYLLDTLSKVQHISTLDSTKGYWQICLEKTQKSILITDMGLCELKVLPFGLMSLGVMFWRLINYAFSGLNDFACAYIDDIAIFSGSWEEHL